MFVFFGAYAVNIGLLLYGIYQNKLSNADNIGEIISDLFNVGVGVVTLIVFIVDLIFYIRHQRHTNYKSSLTWFQRLRHYYQDDPLLFRWEMLIVFLIILFGLPTVFTGPYTETSYSVLIVDQILLNVVHFLLLLTAGAFVGIAALVNFLREKRVKQDDNAVKKFLKNPTGFELLSNYARSEWSVENILLYSDIQACKNIQDPKAKRTKIQEIINCYLRQNSIMEVNIPDDIRRDCILKFENEDDNRLDEITARLETATLQNIYDTFSRFQQTLQYKTYIMAKNFSFSG